MQRRPTTIEAAGRVVAPGFIDAHAHSETALRGNGEIWGSILQGVTTHLTAPDGFGWAPLPPDACAELWRSTAFAYGQPDMAPAWPTMDAYLDGFDGTIPLNVVPMAPHQPIRFAVMGWDDRPPTPPRWTGCGRSRATGWRRARSGLNTGLDYQPAANSVDRGARRARQGRRRVRRRVRRPHPLQRDRPARRLPRVDRDRPSRGRADPAVARVRRRRDRAATRRGPPAGVDFGIDWYLYPAGSSHLLVWLPPEDQLGGFDATVQRLARRPGDHRRKVAAIIEEQIASTHAIGAPRVLLGHPDRPVHRDVDRRGRRRARHERRRDGRRPDHRGIARRHPRLPARHQLGRRSTRRRRRTLNHPAFMVASDSVYHGALPHPRGYGCYAQVLGAFVRETRPRHPRAGRPPDERSSRPSASASRDRGRIAEGLAADLVVFDPATVGAGATWAEPRSRPDRHRRCHRQRRDRCT